MITLTALFGQDAVTEYENTRTIPSADKEFPDGSLIHKKEFATIAERDAYVAALEDSDGTSNWRIIQAEVPATTKLQFRTTDNQEWQDFPAFPTVENFNNYFPAEFMRGYYSSNEIAWEDDMQRFIDDELSIEEIKERRYDVTTKEEAEVEMKRLRQIILNETFSDFFSDLIAGKIEFRRVPQND